MGRFFRKKGSSDDSDGGPSGRGLTAQQWVLALLIGLATVMGAFFGWRAAAIGSTAAFDDRQSISETIKVEQQEIDVDLSVTDDTREYTRYLANYALAAELDNQAGSLAAAGNTAGAAETRREAQVLRRAATERAADSGVFGPFTIADDLREPRAEPRTFNVDERLVARRAELATAIGSPGQLDPQVWADESEAIRQRIKGLSIWIFILIFGVLMFTVAQVNSERRTVFYGFVALAVAALLVGIVGGFAADFFA